MFGFPKPKRKTKVKKPLRRSRKRIKPRGKFLAFGSNKLKTYKRKRTDDEVMQYALQCRAERLANRTRAEMAFSELLYRMEIDHEIEKIFLNGDRAVLIDFFLPKQMLAIEIDGGIHHKQQKYDAGRDRWLLETYGVRTVRITNRTVCENGDGLRLQVESLARSEVFGSPALLRG